MSTTETEIHAAPVASPDEVITDPATSDEHERFAHIVLEAVRDQAGEIHSIGNSVVEGSIYGTPVRALCGKVWVPGRDPRRYPLCPTCKEIALQMGWKLPAS